MSIYFDHAATTPLCDEAFAAMQPYLRENYGNPSSLHHMGKAAQYALEVARTQMAALLNARPAEVLFTSGATEGSNHALKGAAWHRRERGRHIIVSKLEHDAVTYPIEALENEGFEITRLEVEPDGIVDPERLKSTFRDDTILVSVMHANNELGTLQPVQEIGAICRERDVLFHCDAVQTVGHIPVDVREMNVDLLTLSAHKFYGPKGAGALFIRRGVRINTLIDGGHQQKGRRGGTENVPGIVGMGTAAEVAAKAIANGDENAVAVLRDQLIEGIEANVDGAFLNGHRTNRIPGVVNFSFDGIEGEGLILEMDAKAGVCLSTGSACAAGSLDPSPVLLAIGRPNGLARAGTRFSLGRDNTAEEVNQLVQLLPEVLSSLRALKPGG
jgi:cysteine desulfurase